MYHVEVSTCYDKCDVPPPSVGTRLAWGGLGARAASHTSVIFPGASHAGKLGIATCESRPVMGLSSSLNSNLCGKSLESDGRGRPISLAGTEPSPVLPLQASQGKRGDVCPSRTSTSSPIKAVSVTSTLSLARSGEISHSSVTDPYPPGSDPPVPLSASNSRKAGKARKTRDLSCKPSAGSSPKAVSTSKDKGGCNKARLSKKRRRQGTVTPDGDAGPPPSVSTVAVPTVPGGGKEEES